MSEIWQRIEHAMKDRGWTKGDLARIAKVSPSSVQKWESGGRITLEPAVLLGNALGIPPSELTPRADPHDPAAEQFLREASRVVGARAVRQRPAPYPQPPVPVACRFPPGCDLEGRLTEMQSTLSTLTTQVDTLTRLLGAALVPSSQTGAAQEKKKAG